MAKAPSLQSVGVNTSETFIQKLKGSHDPIPVEVNGPSSSSSPVSISKIQLAQLAWSLAQSNTKSPQDVAIPQLSSVLFSWLLDSLSLAAKSTVKAKSTSELSSTCLCDPAYYTLLASILSARGLNHNQHPLGSATSRMSPQAILLIAHALLKIRNLEQLRSCFPMAAGPLSLLLEPLMPTLLSNQGTRQVLDEIMQYACEMMDDFDEEGASDEPVLQGMAQLLQTICGPMLESADAARSIFSWKSHTYFLEQILSPWSRAIHRLTMWSTQSQKSSRYLREAMSKIHKNLRSYAEAILFSSPATKQLLFPSSIDVNTKSSLTNMLNRSLEGGNLPVLTALPLLFRFAVRALEVHSDDLRPAARADQKRKVSVGATTPSGPAGQSNEYLDKEEIQQTLELALFHTLLKPALKLIEDAEGAAAPLSAQSRCHILQAVLETRFGTTLSENSDWHICMDLTIQRSLVHLAQAADVELVLTSMTTIHLVWKIAQHVARQRLDQFAKALCTRSPIGSGYKKLEPVFKALSDDVLTSFARSQEIPALITILASQIASDNARPWRSLCGLSSQSFTTAISDLIAAYLPPTQIGTLLNDQATLLEELLAKERGEGDRLVKRKAGDEVALHSSIPLSNALRFAQPVLSALNIPAALTNEALPPLIRIQAVIRGIILLGSSSAEIQPPAKKARKSTEKTREGEYEHQITIKSPPLVASALWCWYGTCTALKKLDQGNGSEGFPHLSNSLQEFDHSWPILFSPFLQNRGRSVAEGELLIEIVRLLLFRKEVELESHTVFPSVSTEQNLEQFWTSVLDVVEGQDGDTVTQGNLWEMLTRRWLMIINVSPPQQRFLARLSDLLLDTLVPSAADQTTLHQTSIELSRNAEFLELHVWRKILMERVEERTAETSGRQHALRTLAALAAFPVQYIPSGSKEGLAQRAMEITCEGVCGTESIEDHKAVRNWLAEVARLTVSLTAFTTKHILDSCRSLAKEQCLNPSLQEVNENLVRIWLSKLLESQHLTESALQTLVKELEISAFSGILLEAVIESNGERAKRASLSLNCIALTPNESLASGKIAASIFKSARLNLSLLKIQGESGEKLRQSLQSALDLFRGDIENKWSTGSLPPDSNLLQEYLALAAVCFKVGDGDHDITHGRRVFEGFVRIWSQTERLPQGTDGIENAFHCASSQLSVEEYGHTLTTLINELDRTAPVNRAALTSLLMTLGLLLRYGPEGTLTIAQKQFTNLLSRLHHLLREADAGIVSGCLQAIESICNGRAMILRATDASLLLPILSGILSQKSNGGSQVSNRKRAVRDARSIFSSLVGTVGTLIRLRKELLLPLLPHLAIVLTQLLPLFRKPTPGISSQQRTRLLETMPDWLANAWNASEGEGDDDDDDNDGTRFLDGTIDEEVSEVLNESHAREFSRLLYSITAKTTTLSRRETSSIVPVPPAFGVGGGGNATTSKKVDSLSRSFSKHAIYIILAYIHTLLDGSENEFSLAQSEIGRSVKKELLVGLVSLCGIIDQSERDWILVGDLFDGGGKGVFKEIWRAWERGRYKGV